MGSHAQPYSHETSAIYHELEDSSQQIRLLRCIPPADDDELNFELVTIRLDAAPPFRAISYTWGDRTQTSTITLNGSTTAISNNAFYALWQARSRSVDSLLWIDSLCINQSDLAEKSAQVQIMGDIFARADVVYACVGPHADSSELIITTSLDAERPENDEEKVNEVKGILKECTMLQRDIEPAVMCWAFYNVDQWYGSQTGGVPSGKLLQELAVSTFYLALIEFGHRRYWRRLWSE